MWYNKEEELMREGVEKSASLPVNCGLCAYNMKWIARSDATTISEAVCRSSGCSIESLKHPATTEPWDVEGLENAALLIDSCLKSGMRISIIGDYDTDGVTATAILYLMFTALGAKPDIRLPHRMSEGYGLSVSIVDEIIQKNPNGLLLTVDNGISAFDAIAHAKSAGMTVIVLDHHLPGQNLPNADVIVDQWIHPDSVSSFYCGAGLAFKLAQYLLVGKDEILEKLSALAAIGTVGDVMSLTNDNRAIVQNGIAAMDNGHITQGLKCVLEASGKAKFDATTLAFYIVPMINAAGRLLDDGARLPCAILSAENQVTRYAEKLKNLNNERKEMVKTQLDEMLAALGPAETPPSIPVIVFSESCHEGIVGILAGKLAENYHVPAIVFTRTDGKWKGSARSIEGVNLVEHLNKMSGSMLGYGGHAGAAGLTVALGAEDTFRAAAEAAFSDVQPEDSSVEYYDVTLTEDQVPASFEEQEGLEPFGEGCPKPLVRVRNCRIIPGRNGKLAFYMGKGSEHVKLKCHGFAILGFFMSDVYRQLGEPEYVDVIGYLEMNISQYGKELQVNAQAILPVN